jgi:acyl-CoA thioester hydrolase
MGFVYHGHYTTFYEVGRVEALRALGCYYGEVEAQGIIMPVLECASKFLLPARYDERLSIRTSITAMPAVRIYFSYEIENEAGQLIHAGTTTLAFLKKEGLRPCRVPEALRQALEPFFQ